MSPGSTDGDGLFPPLAAGLDRFHARVTGSEGDYRERLLRLAGQDGVLPEVARAVLEAVAEVLTELHAAMVRLARFLLQADAAVALVEVFGAVLNGLGDAMDRDWPPGLARAGDVATTLQGVGGVLSGGDTGDGGLAEVDLPDLIPEPAVVQQIQATSLALVRSRIQPEQPPGDLDDLIQALRQAPNPANGNHPAPSPANPSGEHHGE